MVWGQVVAAQGELNSARALKEAAEVISRSPTALKLRYLQTLNVIAAEKGSTIIFPMPMDIMGAQVSLDRGRGGDGNTIILFSFPQDFGGFALPHPQAPHV